jgi:Homeodomain-like domain
MMTDEQRSKVAALKSAIAASTPTTGGAPREVRAAVLVLREELRQVGTTGRELAKALGIHEATLSRWRQEADSGRGPVVAATRGGAGGSAGFRVVQVTGSAARTAGVASAAVAAPVPRSLRVAHAPSGLVIDGLDVESLAALLRRMS